MRQVWFLVSAQELMGVQVLAIIDIDCAVENGFDEDDQKHLETMATLLAGACDWN